MGALRDYGIVGILHIGVGSAALSAAKRALRHTKLKKMAGKRDWERGQETGAAEGQHMPQRPQIDGTPLTSTDILVCKE
jgi:hypothetical protein